MYKEELSIADGRAHRNPSGFAHRPDKPPEHTQSGKKRTTRHLHACSGVCQSERVTSQAGKSRVGRGHAGQAATPATAGQGGGQQGVGQPNCSWHKLLRKRVICCYVNKMTLQNRDYHDSTRILCRGFLAISHDSHPVPCAQT